MRRRNPVSPARTAVAFVCAASSFANAQCPGLWLTGQDQDAQRISNRVHALVSWHSPLTGTPTGWLVAGGDFRNAGGTPCRDLAVWDGIGWHSPWELGFASSQVVHAITTHGQYLIAGGDFHEFQGADANCVARWDGSAWLPMGDGFGDAVRALAVFNGELIAAGEFGTSGNRFIRRISRWDGTAWQRLANSGIGDGTTGSFVHALTVFRDQLVAGGFFSSAGGILARNIVRFSNDSWQTVGGGMDGPVYALTEFQGDLIAAGNFELAGMTPALRIARWNGNEWFALGSGMNSYVMCLTVFRGSLIAGGSFTTAGGKPAQGVARWNGSEWEPLGSGVGNGTLSFVFAATEHNGELVFGGDFRTAGGESSPYWARWSEDGVPWIAGQPHNSCRGLDRTFRVIVASGYENTTCQWRRDDGVHGFVNLKDGPTGTGSIVSGAMSDQLTISRASIHDAGSYDCVVDSSCGAVASLPAILSVCDTDFDCDGSADGADVEAFVAAFEAGDTSADFDRDGFISGIDFDLYVQSFEEGC